jgi:hypothetical protein
MRFRSVSLGTPYGPLSWHEARGSLSTVNVPHLLTNCQKIKEIKNKILWKYPKHTSK